MEDWSRRFKEVENERWQKGKFGFVNMEGQTQVFIQIKIHMNN